MCTPAGWTDRGVVVAARRHRWGEVQVTSPGSTTANCCRSRPPARDHAQSEITRPPSAGRQPPDSPGPAPRAQGGPRGGELDDGGHMRDVVGKDDEVRERPEEREAVGLVDEQLLGSDNTRGPHDRFQLVTRARLRAGECGHQRRKVYLLPHSRRAHEPIARREPPSFPQDHRASPPRGAPGLVRAQGKTGTVRVWARAGAVRRRRRDAMNEWAQKNAPG